MDWLTFHLDAGSLLSPLLLAVILYALKQARDRVIEHFDAKTDSIEHNVEARHVETQEHLNRIEVQTTKTNGRVTELEKRLDKLETEEELLMKLYLKDKAP